MKSIELVVKSLGLVVKSIELAVKSIGLVVKSLELESISATTAAAEHT